MDLEFCGIVYGYKTSYEGKDLFTILGTEEVEDGMIFFVKTRWCHFMPFMQLALKIDATPEPVGFETEIPDPMENYHYWKNDPDGQGVFTISLSTVEKLYHEKVIPISPGMYPTAGLLYPTVYGFNLN